MCSCDHGSTYLLCEESLKRGVLVLLRKAEERGERKEEGDKEEKEVLEEAGRFPLLSPKSWSGRESSE